MKQRPDPQSLFIDANASLLEAFRTMDACGVKLLMVGGPGLFERFVSVGDVQRAIIGGASIDSPVAALPERVNLTVDAADGREAARALLLRYRAPYTPALTADGGVARVFFWEEFFETEPLPPRVNLAHVPVVIMAGGLGSRLRPLTNVIPKPLIPVGDRSILEHILDRFSQVGCSRFHLTVNYLADVLRYYVDHRTEYAERVTYVDEPTPLGTAGSLHLLAGELQETFFVTNCDILIDQDYSEIYEYHRERGNIMTVVTALRHHSVAYGTVESDHEGRLTRLVEKPELTYAINAGMYILEPELLVRIPRDRVFHITELIESLRAAGERVGVFPVSEGSWHDIGVWSEYLKIKDKPLG